MCGGNDLVVRFTYSEPPPLETRFPLASVAIYWREIHCCRQCGHYLEWFEPDQGALYSGEYVSSLYQDVDGIKRTFDKINALPPDRSDNIGRVCFVDAFCRGRFKADFLGSRRPRLLDVGAGLGVFPFRMKAAGWDCTTIDMDPRLVEHHHRVVGVDGMMADVRRVEGLGTFDLITFNKVLEHVADPTEMLASAGRLLAPGGLVYVELPDGEAAEIEGKEREEYLLGHMHVFSYASFALLIARAGFEVLMCERLREPSTKFTLRGFARTRSAS
jgi:2-polyprenyl-3-methyl-5-hydroxy-6-metoxy-1,4-benzoquinol methylase